MDALNALNLLRMHVCCLQLVLRSSWINRYVEPTSNQLALDLTNIIA